MRWVGVFLAFVGSLSSNAKPEVPTFQKIPGKPVRASFSDGRVAELAIHRKPPLIAAFPFEITDNTCTDSVRIPCVLNAGFGVDSLKMQWIAHPDAKRIGQSIQIEKQSPGEFPNLYTFADQLDFPKLASGIPPLAMRCGDYSWLPGGGSKPPPTVRVTRWDAEGMRTNPETGLMENRTSAVATKMVLRANAAGDLLVDKNQRYLGGTFGLFVGDIWALILPTSTGDHCHLSIKADYADLVPQLIALFTKPAVEFEPYLYGADEYSSSKMPAFLRAWMEEGHPYEIE